MIARGHPTENTRSPKIQQQLTFTEKSQISDRGNDRAGDTRWRSYPMLSFITINNLDHKHMVYCQGQLPVDDTVLCC